MSEAKKLLLTFDQHFDQKKATIPQICQLFAPNTLGDSAVLRKSFRGRFSSIFKRSEPRMVQDEKVKKVFLEAITVLQKDLAACQKIPLSTRLAVHQAFQSSLQNKERMATSLSEEVVHLQQLADQKKAEQEDTIHKASLLRTSTTKADKAFDLETFSNLFSHREELSLKAFLYLKNFLIKQPEVNQAHLTENLDLLQQGRKLRKRLQTHLLPRGRTLSVDERQARMKIQAEDLSKTVLGMETQQRWMFCGGYGQKLAALTSLLRLYKFLPEDKQAAFPAPIRSFLKEDSLPHPRDFVKDNVRKALQELQAQCPELGKFLDEPLLGSLLEGEDRHLPEKFKRWLPQFIGKHVETWMNEGLIKQILLLVPEGGASQFLLWLSENGHHVTSPKGRETFIKELEKRIIDYTEQHFDETTGWIDDAINTLYKNIRKTFPDKLLKATGFDSLVDAGSCWLDFEKQKNGKYTLSIYSSGSALSLHDSDPKSGKVNWPKRLYNIEPNKLTPEFFQRVLHHSFEPQCNPKAISSAENFYNGVLKYLGGTAQVFAPPKEDWRNIPTYPISDLHLAEVFLTKPKVDRPDSILLFEMRLEALITFCKPYLTGSNKTLVIDNPEAAKLIDKAQETLYEQALQLKDYLGKSQFERIEATRKEIIDSLRDFRAGAAAKEIVVSGKITSRALPLPTALVRGMQTMLQGSGLTAEDIKKSKETLCWAFGDEIGEVLEDITTSLKDNSLDVKKVKDVSKPTRKGELHAFFTQIYVTVAISALKAGMFIAAVMESELAYLLIIPGIDVVLRRILPHPFFDWYTNVIDRLLFILKKLAVTFLLRSLFAKKDIQHMEGQIKEWQQKIQSWSKALTDKQIMTYRLETPMAQQTNFTSFKCETRGLEFTKKDKTCGKIDTDEGFRTLRVLKKSPETHDELIDTLKISLEEIKKEYPSGTRPQISYALHLIERLQIPLTGKGDHTIWDTLPDPEEALELLSDIGVALQIHAAADLDDFSSVTEIERSEAILSIYHLFSIMDRLARRCPEAKLEGYRTNAFPLLYFLNSPGACFDDPEKLERMKKICHYFMPEIDIDELPDDLSKDPRIQKMMQGCIFDYTTFESSSSTDLPEIRYLKEFLKKPGMDQKLRDIGVAENASEDDKLSALFVESLVFTRKPSLLPRSYSLLKFHAHLANKVIIRQSFSSHNDSFGRKQMSPPCLDGYASITKKSWCDKLLPIRIRLPKKMLSESLDVMNHAYLSEIEPKLSFLSVPKSQITEQRTQSEVMMDRISYRESKNFSEKNFQKQFEMIQCENDDSIFRTIGFLRKYKSKLFSDSLIEHSFQTTFFRAGYLKRQLLASPASAKAIGEFVNEFFEFHYEQKHYTECLWIINSGIKLQRYVAKFAPEYLSSFPNFSALLNKIIEEKPKYVLGKALALTALTIPNRPDKLGAKEKSSAAFSLCRTLFHPMKYEYDTYITNDKNQKAFCNENYDFKQRFRAWTTEILVHLNNHDFRLKLLKIIADDLQLDLSYNKESKWKKIDVWKWSYGNLNIDFYTGELSFEGGMASDLEELKNIKKSVERISPLADQLRAVGPGVFETPDKSFRVEYVPPNLKALKCFAIIDGKKFRYVNNQIPTDLREYFEEERVWNLPIRHACWIEETTKAEKIMRIESRGKPTMMFIVISTPGNPNNYKLKCLLSGPKELLVFKGSEIQPLLAPIARFCPLKDITCWVQKNQTQVHRIDMNRHNLSFEVVSHNGELRAIDKRQYPNYYIAPKQSDSVMKGFASYLLLENENGNKKALVPIGQMVSSGAMRMLPLLGLEGPLAKFVEQLLSQLNEKEYNTGYYAYDIDSLGNLQSDNPEALAYILMLYLLQGNSTKAMQACQQLELMCKRQPIDQHFIKLLLPLAFVPGNFEEFTLIRRRLLSALEENRLAHTTPQSEAYNGISSGTFADIGMMKNINKMQSDLAFALIALMDLNQMQDQHEPRRDLTETQEWFLFQSVFSRLEGTLKFNRGAGINYTEVLKKTGWDSVMELVGMPPKLTQRYIYLQKKYGKQRSLVGRGILFAAKVITAPSILSPSNFLPKVVKDSLDLKKNAIEALSIVGTYLISNSKKYYLNWKNEMLPYKIVKPPLSINEMTSAKLKKYFRTYYAIARGEETKEERQQLKEVLQLFKGGWDMESRLLMGYLEAVIRFPRIFQNSKALEEAFLKELGVMAKESNKNPLGQFFFELDIRSRISDVSPKIGLVCTNGFISQFAIPNLFEYASTWTGFSALDWLGSKKFFWGQKLIYASIPTQEIKNIEVPKAPIGHETPSYSFLNEEDKKIDSVLSRLFNLAFEIKQREKDSKKDRLKHFKTDGLDAAQRARTERVNRSLKDYYKRQDRIPVTFKLRSPEKLWDVYIQLTEERDALKNQVDREHAALLAAVNPSHLSLRHPVTFDDLKRFLLKGSFGELGLEIGLKAEDLKSLETAIIRDIAKQSRLKQMERALKHFEALAQLDPQKERLRYEERLELLIEELRARRAYNFENLPPKLLRRFMIFELISDKILWKKQSKAMEKLLLGPHGDAVIELLMSFGKTYFGIPTIDSFEADGKQVVVNIWHEAMAGENTRFISRQGHQIFGQTAHALPLKRQDKLTAKNFSAINAILQGARVHGETINMTKQEAQAGELIMLDQLYRFTNNSIKDKAQLRDLLEQIKIALATLRSTGKVIGDEAHELFPPKDEFNYPIGESLTINNSLYDVSEMTMRWLAEDPAIMKLIQDMDLQKISKEEYQTKIVPKLANKLSTYPPFDLKTEVQKQEFMNYISGISGEVKTVPQWISQHEHFNEISMSKGLLTVLLPLIFSRTVHVNYGPSSVQGNGEFARPYDGNNSPLETATIRSPYESLVKTFVMFLCRGISVDQAHKLILKLQGDARNEMRTCHIDAKETIAYKNFAKIFPNIDLMSVYADSGTNDKLLEEQMMHNNEAIFCYVRYCVLSEIRYWKRNIRSDAQNFASMFKSQFYDTGTPYNDECYPSHLKMLWDPGTIGEALDIISKKCPPDGINLLRNKKPIDILNEVLHVYFKPGTDFTAIIDGGALLKGLDNEWVAKVMLAYCQKRRPDIRAVVFFKKDKSGKDQLMCLEAGAKDPILLENCHVPLHQRLTYFDQRHGFAADVPQKANGKGINLVGEPTLQRLMQEVFRFRGIKKFKKLFGLGGQETVNESNTQQMYFAMTEETAAKISPTQKPTLRDLITYAIKNEADQIAESNYHSYKQKIANIIRRAILDKMEFAPNVDVMTSIFTEFEKTLVPFTEDDPKKLYGLIDAFVPPKQALKAVKENAYKAIKNSKTFTEEEKGQIKQRLEDLFMPPMPKLVHVYTDGKDIHTDMLDDLEREVGQEVEQDQQKENDNELNRETELHAQHQSWFETPFKEMEWPSAIKPYTLEWLKISPTPKKGKTDSNWKTLLRRKSQRPPTLFSFKEALNESSTQALKPLSPIMDQRLWFSNNFVPYFVDGLFQDRTEVGDSRQRELFETLIFLKKEGDKFRVISMGALTEKEADAWRKKLRAKPEGDNDIHTILYDMQSRTSVAGSQIDLSSLKKDKDFMLLETQLKFLNGDETYTEQVEVLKEWVQKNQLAPMKNAYNHIHSKRKGTKMEGSDIDIVLNPNRLR